MVSAKRMATVALTTMAGQRDKDELSITCIVAHLQRRCNING